MVCRVQKISCAKITMYMCNSMYVQFLEMVCFTRNKKTEHYCLVHWFLLSYSEMVIGYLISGWLIQIFCKITIYYRISNKTKVHMFGHICVTLCDLTLKGQIRSRDQQPFYIHFCPFYSYDQPTWLTLMWS